MLLGRGVYVLSPLQLTDEIRELATSRILDDDHLALEYCSIPSSCPAKISTMRILLNIHIPHEPFNAAVRDGTAGQKLGRIVDEIKPEAVYFTEQHGQRGAVMIVEMSDPSKIPTLAEPWFLTFNANVEFRVVMTPDDLKKAGLDEIGKKWA